MSEYQNEHAKRIMKAREKEESKVARISLELSASIVERHFANQERVSVLNSETARDIERIAATMYGGDDKHILRRAAAIVEKYYQEQADKK